MPIYKAPVEDVNFLLNDVFQIDRYDNLPGFSDASSDVREAILGEAAKLAEEVLQPLNRTGDLEGCKRADDGSVTTPKGFKEAFKQVAEGGWLGLSVPTEYGGQGLPVTLSQAVNEFQISANMAFSMYGGLTMGATAALLVHGTPEQKQTYVPKMVAGEWTGTMNLTEPHCGTDLGLLRTKAVRQADGSFKITGTKIFISAGEHDLAPNIIHLVLARIEGAPAGIKGVSLFVVPKFLVNKDGSVGARNGVTCGSIEHKMGIHGNSTCVMNYDNAGQAGRSDHRASGRAPHAAHHPRLQRGLARLRDLDRAEERRRPPLQRSEGPPGGRRPHGPDDAGAEGFPHRVRLRQRGAGPADVRRPRLHRRARHGAVRARFPHRHDL
jgi:alkylation response protein AidB-like acyl-CoA dehydrogenase